MTTVASLLTDPKPESWALSTCEFLQAVTDSSLEDAAFRAQVRQLVEAAFEDCDFVHCYLSVAEEMEMMLDEAEKPEARPPTPRPAEPVLLVAPPAVVKLLPDPMTAATRRLVLGSHTPPEKPTEHGCGYFDGAPWDICFACEYEKNPSSYQREVRHSELVQLISAYFRDARAGERIKGWDNETLESMVAFLDTARAARCYTDAQVADKNFRGVNYLDHSLLSALRELNR
jgi:hypothetical protein